MCRSEQDPQDGSAAANVQGAHFNIQLATGILNPVVGALVHNAGSVLVIVNSSLLLKWRKRP